DRAETGEGDHGAVRAEVRECRIRGAALNGVEVVEHRGDRVGERRVERGRVDRRSEVVEVDRGRLTGVVVRRGYAFDDVRCVLAVREADAMTAVALDVVVRAEARRETAVVRSDVAGAVNGIVLVVAEADIERPVVVEVPLVVDKPRVRAEIALVR